MKARRLAEPGEWEERPRGQACPVCRCLVGFGLHMEADKAAHDLWHIALETMVRQALYSPPELSLVTTTAEVVG